MILRVAEMILRLFLPPGDRGESIREDLRQERKGLRAVHTGSSHSFWFLWESVKLAIHFSLLRLRHPGFPGAWRRADMQRGGDPLLAFQQTRQRVGPVMEWILHDLRHAFRSLKRKPAFLAAILIIFALGIGANTVVFSVVRGVLLQPLPYSNPQRLVIPWQTHPRWRDGDNERLRARWNRFTVSFPVYRDWLEESSVFEEVGVHLPTSYIVEGSEQSERIQGTMVTFGIFRALGVQPILGRTFLPEEDKVGGPRLVILSHGLWTDRFGSDPNLLGQVMVLNEQPHTIVGVMPRGFRFPDDGRLWTTFSDEFRTQDRSSNGLTPLARLRPGISLAAAQRSMEALAEQLRAVNSIPGEGFGVNLRLYQDEIVGDARSALELLLAAVGLVLLIACANISSLLLLRASERRREMAVRLSMGAGPGRLFGQLFSEGLAISVLGGGLGLLLAWASLGPFLSFLPPETPRLEEISLDPHVLIFSVALSVITGVLVSILPGLANSGMRVTEVLKDHGRGTLGGRGRVRIHAVLLVSEIALTFVLLAGAGLLTRSFSRLLSVDRGFVADGVLTVRLDLRGSPYSSADTLRQTLEGFQSALRAVPGIVEVAAAEVEPFRSPGSNRSTMDTRSGLMTTPIEMQAVSSSYFSALGIPILSGRTFTPDEVYLDAPVVIVNQALADTFWPEEEPLGQRLKLGGEDSPLPWRTVVGVVGNMRNRLETEPPPSYYLPLSGGGTRIILKTQVDSPRVIGGVREAIQSVSPHVPIVSITPLEAQIARTVAAPRVRTLFVDSLSLFAVCLAVMGIFGLVAQSVSHRTSEIGIRVALGARRGQVMMGVLYRGILVVVAGVATGLPVTLFLARTLDPLLFETDVTNPAYYLGVSILMVAIGLCASVLPARRAMNVEPVEALRTE